MDDVNAKISLAQRYRTEHSLVATQAVGVPTYETIKCLPKEEQISSFGEALTGGKARIVIIDVGKTKNGNIYSAELLRATAPMFEGCKVYYNHRWSDERDARDLAGHLTDVTFEEANQRLTATLNVLGTDTWLRSLLAESPQLVEFSMFTWTYSTSNEDGSETVEEIIRVQSVDIVTTAAGGGKVLQLLESYALKTPPAKSDPLTPGAEDAKKKQESERKDSKMEKQIANLTAKLEALDTKFKGSEEARTKLQLQLDTQAEAAKAELAKAEADAKAEQEKSLADLKAENLKLKNGQAVEAYLTENRKDLKPSIEKAIRRSAESLDEVTTEKLEGIRKNWEAQAAEFAKDLAPAGASLESGMPPAEGKETPKPEGETKPKGVALLESHIFGFMGVDVTPEADKK